MATPTPSNPSGPLGRRGDTQPGEIIEQEVVRVEGGSQVVHEGTVASTSTSGAVGPVVDREVVSIEGAPQVELRQAAPGEVVTDPVVRGEVVHREVLPGASLAKFEREVSEVTRVETVHAEHYEPGLTQDVYTVGETIDPITKNPCELHGIMVEFDESEPLLEAVRKARAAGYRKMDCYSPIPVEGLTDEMGWKDKKVPALMLCGGFVGCISGFMLQYAGMAWFYPVNIGGKPLNSWPQFIVPAFEMTILFTALTGVVSMLVLNGFPSPYHPVFNAPGFDAASTDRFFLVLEEGGPMWNRHDTLQFARTLGGLRVSEVER